MRELLKVLVVSLAFLPATGSRADEKSPAKTPPPPAEKSTTQSSPKGWFIGIRAAYVPSIIGEVGYTFNQTFKLRLIGIGGRYYRAYSNDGQRYDRIRFQNFKIGLMGDWHPWKNGLRISGAVAYNGNKIKLNHTVSGTLLGQPASAYGTITCSYDYKNIAPYLGIGYDSDSLGGTGIVFSIDAGFWIQGKAHSDFSFTGTGQNNSTTVGNLKAHLETLLNKHKLIRNLPMVSLGLRYQF